MFQCKNTFCYFLSWRKEPFMLKMGKKNCQIYGDSWLQIYVDYCSYIEMALTLNPILLYLKADKVGQEKMLPVLDMISIFCLETMQWEQPILRDLFVCSSYKLILRHARQSCITMIREMKERGWMFLHPSSFPCFIQKGSIQLKIYTGKKCDILWMVNKKFRGQ